MRKRTVTSNVGRQNRPKLAQFWPLLVKLWQHKARFDKLRSNMAGVWPSWTDIGHLFADIGGRRVKMKYFRSKFLLISGHLSRGRRALLSMFESMCW